MKRGPPTKTKKERMVEIALRMAYDDAYGYSQKPPSGRWGPDFDCSSFIYVIANLAGYDVDIGSDKVRFTGTMLKDFEKAGFQVLPFANVGLSDLKIGDILLNLALHAEVYVGEGKTVAATGSETGGYVGESGDQTGHEIEQHDVKTFDKEWDYILRPPDEGEDEDLEEGDIMPINYGPMPMTQSQPWGQNGMPYGYPQGGMQNMGYPQNNMMNRGYPQGGNLGQMNGYSQASAGGYPQSNQMPMGPQGQNNGMQSGNQSQHIMTDCCFVKGIEGARNSYGVPNTKKPVFDEDKSIFYWITYGSQGTPIDIHPYKFMDDFESMEEMPQHLSPLMQDNNSQMPMQSQEMPITREELKNMIKEMMHDESTSQSANSSSQQRNANNGSRNGGNRSSQ